ncbi:6-hydroxy-D-nicotine oxidase [Chaetomidium leptoderma]|uniref:6-hydroxy-D-nicotine oxidase n=1 Tax=Chaetomidium leptoderma TaxID=669021 RepID=A0AAN6VHA5_9PEZI|nr:6-hydroxy-D-nicotine oxidase [Chaetomidium leptoderma]
MWNFNPPPRAGGLLIAILIAVTSLAIAAFSSSSNTPHNHNPNHTHSLLTPLLSTTAQILLPNTPEFNLLLAHRWSSNPLNTPPKPSLIVIPTTESDVAQTIRHANAHNLPFLATTGGHGTTTRLSTFPRNDGGVLIYLRNLTKFELAPDGQTAVLGGGLLTGEVVRALWRAGKQTTTGICSCVSFVGPALGGGHGFLQGRFGLVADQVLGGRVVLGDGEVVDLLDTDREDLFWGLRGAGHNFGVVSQLTVRVYDVVEEKREWAYEVFTFTGERLEEVYKVAEGIVETQTADMMHWSVWAMDVDVDPDKPVILFTVVYNGPMADCQKYTHALHAASPAAYLSGVTEYPNLPMLLGADVDGPNCKPTGTAMVRAADVVDYDIDALRNWYDIFSDTVATEKGLAKSICLLEGYSVQAVQAVPAASTAFPHRRQRLLLAPFIQYDVGNSTLDAIAERWGDAMETAAFGGSERRTYVNYAHGHESLQALYGYEPWRLQKLQALKRKYDPENRFRFYAPIV